MAELSALSIVEAAKGLSARDFSAEDLANACIAEIGRRDGEIGAYVYVDEEGALSAARAVDQRRAKGEELSMLAGIPLGVKDLFNTRGVRTTCCSEIIRDFVPPYDAEVVGRLRELGAVCVGKTNMDEFACGASTEHSCFGVTKNPYDLSRVAGGSSGGSAAAVAANMCFYALGTDTGGSIRQPASLCGVYGFKPTYGRVSRSGVTAMASSWDTVGPFTRSVEDMALVMETISGHSRFDQTTPEKAVPSYLSVLGKEVKGLKIGLPKEYFGEGIEEETATVVRAAAEKLEKAGAEVREVSLPSTKYAVAVYYITMPAELSANLARFDGVRFGSKTSAEAENMVDFYAQTRGEGFGDEIKRRIMIGTYVLSAGYYDAYYKRAQKVRTVIIQDFERVFAEVDVLIAPVSPFPAFKIGELVDDPLAMYMADALAIPASAAGLPAFACPAGRSSLGLPIGLQIIAPQFGEERCFHVGSALERMS